MRFFAPDWDDRVDPGYDFETDRSTLGRDPYSHDLYAHEYFERPCYDGVLVSRSALAGPKEERIRRVGLRRFLRVPASMEVIGDCGAFGYVSAELPAYSTEDVLHFYRDAGVDYGVSVDHIIFPAFPEQRNFRYELTLRNAEEFLTQHRRMKLAFEPVGAVQGWDAQSYAAAAKRLVAMGYRMLAVGGLVRSRTEDILATARAVVAAVEPGTRLHLLGVAREPLTEELLRLGIYSFDSASPMRTAWLSATRNYLLGQKAYTAIRIPFSAPTKGIRTKHVLSDAVSRVPYAELKRLEQGALAAVRHYAKGSGSLSAALAALVAYDDCLVRQKNEDGGNERRIERYRETLADRPWLHCRCEVCRELGVEVLIFRGANRNRRRGFHNVLNFYERLLLERRLAAFPTAKPSQSP